jgi:ribosomal protein L37AE/L43A
VAATPHWASAATLLCCGLLCHAMLWPVPCCAGADVHAPQDACRASSTSSTPTTLTGSNPVLYAAVPCCTVLCRAVQVLTYMRPKMHAVLLDATINSARTLRLNIYQVGTHTQQLKICQECKASRLSRHCTALHSYLCCISSESGPAMDATINSAHTLRLNIYQVCMHALFYVPSC